MILVEVLSSRLVRADLREPENTVQNECVIDNVIKIVYTVPTRFKVTQYEHRYT